MRIDPRLPAGALRTPSGSPNRASGGVFRLGDAPKARAAGSSTSVASLDAILMLQVEDEGGQERRRRSARRGQDLLDALEDLKAGLLAGRLDPANLQRLVTRLALRSGPSGEPGLDEVVSAIELRARVELAKRGIV